MKTVQSILILCAAALASASWQVVSPDVATVVASVSFTDNSTGYAPAGQNGAGAEILKTSDGASSWKTVNTGGGLMYLTGAASGRSAVVGGVFTLMYTSNAGGSWNDSTQHDGFIAATQSSDAYGGNMFAVAGEGMGKSRWEADPAANLNGVSVSTNSGQDFSFKNISALKTGSRYVSLASKNVWYVSAGMWPDNERTKLLQRTMGLYVHRRLSSRLVLAGYQADGSDAQVLALPLLEGAGNDDTTTDDDGPSPGQWQAQIVKTSDGGQTFESVFWDEGNFYFNQISCGSEDHCCAVGEADAGPSPGVRIYCTQDGGKSWTRTFFSADPQMSVMAIEFVEGAKEVWAAGGHLSYSDFQGYFWHSTDGGQTWANETVPDVYGNHLSFPSQSVGYASSFDKSGTSSILKYTA